MTPTSEERREVARAMRDWADRYPKCDFTWGVLGSVHYRIDGVDTRPSSNQEVLYMLADLIDPTCHAVRNDSPADDEFVCSECGALVGIEDMFMSNYCEKCGARVVSGDGK